MFQEALARCERGETGGIVVARLDRFARSAVDALESIKRLNEAGARLVSVEDNFDGSTPMGRFAIGILTLIAELELERIKENWAAPSAGRSSAACISRRVRRPATGATRMGGLIREEPAARAVRRGLPPPGKRRVLDARCQCLDRAGDQAADRQHALVDERGRDSWCTTRVYLGQARSGKYVNEGAHEPIVTRAEFDAAQATRTLLKARDGSIAARRCWAGWSAAPVADTR